MRPVTLLPPQVCQDGPLSRQEEDKHQALSLQIRTLRGIRARAGVTLPGQAQSPFHTAIPGTLSACRARPTGDQHHDRPQPLSCPDPHVPLPAAGHCVSAPPTWSCLNPFPQMPLSWCCPSGEHSCTAPAPRPPRGVTFPLPLLSAKGPSFTALTWSWVHAAWMAHFHYLETL